MECLVPLSAKGAEPAWVELRPEAQGDDRVVAGVWVDDARAGEVVYGAWPEMTVIHALSGGPVAVDGALRVLTARCGPPDGPRDHFHLGVTEVAVLRWYLGSPLARGTVVTGTIDGQIVYHDRLVRLDLDAAGEIGVVVSWSRELDRLDDVANDPVGLLAMLTASTSSARIGALRELGRHPDLDVELRDRAFFFALLDTSFEVRRFASLQMVAYLPGSAYLPDLDVVLEHLARPLQSLDVMDSLPAMPAGWRFVPAHGSRNKRYALLWVLGGMAVLAPDSPEVSAWRAAATPRIRAELMAGAAAWSSRQDRALLGLVERELAGEASYGIGEGEVGLFCLLRYVVLRYRALSPLAGSETERFYWLMEMVDAIAPSVQSPRSGRRRRDEDPVLAAVFGPLPRACRRPAELPAWLVGRWSVAAPPDEGQEV